MATKKTGPADVLKDFPRSEGISAVDLSEQLLIPPAVWANKFYASLQGGTVCRITFCEAAGDVEKARVGIVMSADDMVSLRNLLTQMEEVMNAQGETGA